MREQIVSTMYNNVIYPFTTFTGREFIYSGDVYEFTNPSTLSKIA